MEFLQYLKLNYPRLGKSLSDKMNKEEVDLINKSANLYTVFNVAQKVTPREKETNTECACGGNCACNS